MIIMNNSSELSPLQSPTAPALPSVPAPLSTPPRRRLALPAVRDNPVILKEMRSRMRGPRAFIMITVYLMLLSCIIGSIYLGFDTSMGSSVGTPVLPQTVGKSVFGAVVSIELLMVCFLAPALTAGAIAAERERQTFDLLRTTLLPARALVLGKLISAMSFLLLLLFVGFPIQSLAFLFGGVSIEEVLVSFLLLLVTALAFSTVGLFFSSFIRSTLASTVISYVGAILLVFGVPMVLTIALGFFGGLSGWTGGNPTSAQQTLVEIILYVFGYLLVAVNPLATLIASELMFTEQQALFFTTLPLSNNMQFPIVAPWITYFLLYFLLSLALIWLSIHFVRRVET